jgi:hypothetical protein
MPACRSLQATSNALWQRTTLCATGTVTEHQEVFHAIRVKEARHLSDVLSSWDSGNSLSSQVTGDGKLFRQEDVLADPMPITRFAVSQVVSQRTVMLVYA